jgi:hypothetical protein
VLTSSPRVLGDVSEGRRGHSVHPAGRPFYGSKRTCRRSDGSLATHDMRGIEVSQPFAFAAAYEPHRPFEPSNFHRV